MNKALQIVRRNEYTLRVLQGDYPSFEIKDIVNFVEFVSNEIQLPEHLFITMLFCPAFGFSEDPQDVAWGVYRDGVQDIIIALDEENVEEIYLTIGHEMFHYIQDLEGTLGQSEEVEDAAERKAVELYTSWQKT